ncbi:MAG: DUF1634 domain-containing protein [Acidobacteria bacterium]|nr:DUF1634 domain-containing protein [Acidobacteriota bacterium]
MPNKPDLRAQDNVYSGVYRTLVAGMYASTTCFGIGVALALLRPSTSFTVDGAHNFHYSAIPSGILHADPISFMALGTILTILTPIARVAVSLIAFILDRDRTFAWITLLVLLSAVLSLALGLLGLRA